MSNNPPNSDSRDAGVYIINNKGENNSTSDSHSISNEDGSDNGRIMFERESQQQVIDDIRWEQSQNP